MQVSNLSVDQLKKVISEVLDEKDVATKKDIKRLDNKIEKLATKIELKKLDKKFDKLFNFLDKDYLRVKQDVRNLQSRFRLPVSNF